MNIAALAFVCLLTFAAAASAAEPAHAPAASPAPEGPRPHVDVSRRTTDPQRARTCFNAAETREKIISRRLSEPFRLLRGAAGRIQGEALRARLCRWNDDYVYEIALLRHDGRIVHVYLNATSGQTVGAFNDHQ